MRALLLLFVLLGIVGCRGAKPAAASEPAPESRVVFPSLDGDLTGGAPTRLDAVLFRPRGAGPFPAVILLHGCGGLFKAGTSEMVARDREWALRIQELGYVAILSDSFNPRGITEACTDAHSPVRGSRERVADAFGALVFAQSLPFVQKDRIGLMGWSHGGGAVLSTVAASAHARPADLAADFRVAIAFYPPCGRLLEQRSLSIKTPLTILIGDKDDWSPVAPCVELAERETAKGEHVDVVTYPGAVHGFDSPNMKVHVRHGIRTDSGTATVGTDPVARADSIARVTEILKESLSGAARAPARSRGAASR